MRKLVLTVEFSFFAGLKNAELFHTINRYLKTIGFRTIKIYDIVINMNTKACCDQ